MTDTSQRLVSASIEWARLGKEKKDAGYRVRECSNGTLEEQNFKDLLTRYSPGTLELTDLPQVTISWSKVQQPGLHYIGIAMYYGREDDQGDASGRWVMQTNYFCIPFRVLAGGSVSYMALYNELVNVPLPRVPNDPISAELPAPSPEDLAVSPLLRQAMWTAAALLTSRPVCVLGAERVDYVDRLRFIDMVAAHLPYGMRGELSASTWASPTYRTHKLRLFFADADRGRDDKHVYWNQTGDELIGHGYADEYLYKLRSGELTPDLLATETTSARFDQRSVLQMLERLPAIIGRHNKQPVHDPEPPGKPEPVNIVPPVADSEAVRAQAEQQSDRRTEVESGRPSAWSREPATIANVSLGSIAHDDAPSGATDGLADGDLAEILSSCGYALRQGDEELLEKGIEELRGRRRNYPSKERNQIKEILRERELLAERSFHFESLPKLHALLLDIAFSNPIKFHAYKRIEEVAALTPGQRLHDSLAMAVYRAPKEGAARLLILNSLDDALRKVAIAESPIAPYESVAMLVESQLDIPYVEIVMDMALFNLRESPKKGKGDRESFREALWRHRLLPVLQQRYADSPDRLHYVLDKILKYAYSDGLNYQTARQLLDQVPMAPADALFGAMMPMLTPKDRGNIFREFWLRRINYSGLSEEKLDSIRSLILQKEEVAQKPSKPPGRVGHSSSVANDFLVRIFIIALCGLIVAGLGVVVYSVWHGIR